MSSYIGQEHLCMFVLLFTFKHIDQVIRTITIIDGILMMQDRKTLQRSKVNTFTVWDNLGRWCCFSNLVCVLPRDSFVIFPGIPKGIFIQLVWKVSPLILDHKYEGILSIFRGAVPIFLLWLYICLSPKTLFVDFEAGTLTKAAYIPQTFYENIGSKNVRWPSF